MDYDSFISSMGLRDNSMHNDSNSNIDNMDNNQNNNAQNNNTITFDRENEIGININDENDSSNLSSSESSEEQVDPTKKEKYLFELDEFQYKHIKKYDSHLDVKCPICLSKFKRVDIIKELPCKHIYHKGCVLTWLKSSNLCPLCKYDIKNDIISYNEQKDDEEDEK